ncbi:endo alpha-1,4 polygalactosaminidase [Conexibacter woesei]|uniref:Glycoside-hydrolase family GH114 TIM-barrel domain-containing protein n=1 Tax=Conexibacter woesei (strain DSM 14684 / CCUG 47730 / CIP 108061 / JCM 11494 / NBRC 100937 / ID131577) TaxID=469383 RepID=D3FBB0_CONWI|nr:endo alpha-1,4 polygalactosaminidase [Conexibacter woesei]ADB53302.1 hypothetical protein Cwoe_4890 [Conexibacter woesei DSM 14684]
MGSRLRAAVAAAALLGVCTVGSTAAQAYTLPPANGQFDYQIGAPYTPVAAVRVVSRDRLVSPVDPPGRAVYDVCYVNAFQTQPAEVEWWRLNYPTLLLRDSSGNYVIDGEWNEILLDTRTSAKRTTLVGILGAWFDRCKADGFDAIEPDNLDSWDRSRGLITRANNLAVMRAMATEAHTATVGTDRSGVAIAQKNTSEIAPQLDGYGYDFVIAEECQLYSGSSTTIRECVDFQTYYGNLVYEIEYTDNEPLYPGDDPDYPSGGTGFYADACRARGASISVILRDRYVTADTHPDYVYRAC